MLGDVARLQSRAYPWTGRRRPVAPAGTRACRCPRGAATGTGFPVWSAGSSARPPRRPHGSASACWTTTEASSRSWRPGRAPPPPGPPARRPPAPRPTATPSAAADRAGPPRAPSHGGPRGRAAVAVTERVEAAVREVLGIDRERPLPRRRGLFELGLDSLTAVELRTRLGAELGVSLTATAVFEHPTVKDLSATWPAARGRRPPPEPDDEPPGAAAVVEPRTAYGPVPASRRSHPGPAGERAEARSAGSATAAEDAVAVIGMACRLPGAGSPERVLGASAPRAGTRSATCRTSGGPTRSGRRPGRTSRPAAATWTTCGLRRGVLPHLAARGGVARPAAAAAAGGGLGGAGGRRAARDHARRTAPQASTSGSTPPTTSSFSPATWPTSISTTEPARRSPRPSGRLSYFLGVTRPQHRRRHGVLGVADRRPPGLPGAARGRLRGRRRRRRERDRRARRCPFRCRRAVPWPPTAAARPSTTPPTGTAAARAAASSSSSRWPPRCGTATACTR